MKCIFLNSTGRRVNLHLVCPTWEWGVAWDLREMRSAWGRGVREGPDHHEAREISSQCSARAETIWRRNKRNGQVGRDEEGSVQTE
jgi:hypothetical protein